MMEKFRRIFVIVADSLGVGAMPDSPAFGDVDVSKYSGTYFSDCRLLPYSHFAEAGSCKHYPFEAGSSCLCPSGLLRKAL